MRDVLKPAFAAAALAAALIISACGGGGSSAANGTLGVSVTDAPACGFDHVYITVSKVRAHQSGDPNVADNDPGWRDIVLSSPQRIDLLSLTNGLLTTLGQTALPAGRYQQMRLVLVPNGAGPAPYPNSVVPTGGAETALTTPSAIQSGIKLIHPFDIGANTVYDVVLDFDACRSVVATGHSGGYLLKPVISVFPVVVSGVIEGWIDPALAAGTPVTVSAQVFDGLNVSVVKTTVADPATGRFVLSPLLDSSLEPASYQLLITAPNHATAQVSSIQVATGATVDVNTSAAPIGLDASPMSTVSGTVSIGGSTTNVDAVVHALQAFQGAAQGEVAFAAANMGDGSYSMALPSAAPKSAAFGGAGMPLVFSAVTASAGQYELLAVTGAGAQQAVPVSVSAGSVTQSFAF
jgi:hypothetical protein